MVAHGEARLKEAAKLGFTAACLPKRVAARGRPLAAPEGVALWEIGHLADLVGRLAAHRQGRRASSRLAPGAGSG
jgi:DNA repair protein RadA/Sms